MYTAFVLVKQDVDGAKQILLDEPDDLRGRLPDILPDKCGPDGSLYDPGVRHMNQEKRYPETFHARRSPASIVAAGSLTLICFWGQSPSLHAQDQTVGVFTHTPDAFPGYTLFSPMSDTDSYLIDNDGRLIHVWETDYNPSLLAYLMEDGRLLRAADSEGLNQASGRFGTPGVGERVQVLDWDGAVIWEFVYANQEHRLHHDVEPLPNGNVLMIAWEQKTAAEAIAAGRDPETLPSGELWPDHVIEVAADGSGGGEIVGKIVWEWHVWDHLVQEFDSEKENFGVVADHPERVDVNINLRPGRGADWQHTNGIDYHPQDDLILLSVNGFDEIWVIDHSTTVAEAAGSSGGRHGKGGDLLYRWGNPQAYAAGTEEDRKLFGHHDARWIPDGAPGAGNITIFNNGAGRPGVDFSSVEEIATSRDEMGNYINEPGQRFGPEEPVWCYVADPPEAFFSGFISGAHRLPNGNTMITDGRGGVFFEVDGDGATVWEYVNPVADGRRLLQGMEVPVSNIARQNFTFRVERYGLDYAGRAGRDLTPGETLELQPSPTAVEDISPTGTFTLDANYPNPFNPSTHIAFELPGAGSARLRIFNSQGQVVRDLSDGQRTRGTHQVQWTAETTKASRRLRGFTTSSWKRAVKFAPVPWCCKDS